jgi:methylated-DNA-[protein]-cysteine S-methyltransferase
MRADENSPGQVIPIMEPTSFTSVSSPFGKVSIVWREMKKGPKVHRIFLSRVGTPSEDLVRIAFPDATPFSDPAIVELGGRIQRFLDGEAVDFELDGIVLEQCSGFQRRVLLAEYEIPRSRVSTYGRIARHLGIPGSARAVGNALSRNPFPLIIPCHRAIMSRGKLGGFQGGPGMKRALLELEGITFSPAGTIITDRSYY